MKFLKLLALEKEFTRKGIDKTCDEIRWLTNDVKHGGRNVRCLYPRKEAHTVVNNLIQETEKNTQKLLINI